MNPPFYLPGAAAAAATGLPINDIRRAAAAAHAAEAAAAAAIPRGCVDILSETLVTNLTMRHGLSMGWQGRTVMQPLPPTSQRIAESAPTSTTGPPDDFSLEDGSDFLDDIKIGHAQLCIIETKELNKILKNENISKERSTQIKQLRRTLKNRGYASTCRDKRMHEEDELRKDIGELKGEIESYMRAIDEYEAAIKTLETINFDEDFPENSAAAAAIRHGPPPPQREHNEGRQAPLPPTRCIQRLENGGDRAAPLDQATIKQEIKQETVKHDY